MSVKNTFFRSGGERNFGSLNIIERKDTKDFSSEELLFLVEQLREHMRIIQLWSLSTENNGVPLEREEQERRKMVYEEIYFLYSYFNEVRSRDLSAFGITFEDLKKDIKFQIRAHRLLSLVEGEGLMKELNKSLDAMLVGVERKSMDGFLLPSTYYDPSVYTQDTVELSAAHLEIDLQEKLLRKHPDQKYQKEIKDVMRLLHHSIHSGMYLDDATLNPHFSLFFLKQQNPKAWEQLIALLRSPAGKEILLTILGKPSTWDDTSGKVPKTGQDSIDLRSQEIFLRLANPLYIALSQSIANIADAENMELYTIEKETLREFYGDLPQELDYDFEGHVLNIEIDQMLETMNLDSKEKAEKFRKIAKIFFNGKNSMRWVYKVIDIPPSDWVEFFEMLNTLPAETNTISTRTESRSASLDFLVDTLLQVSEKSLGFSSQKALLDSRKTNWPLLRSILSFSASPSIREYDIEKKAGKMRKDEEKVHQVLYEILCCVNALDKKQSSQRGSFERGQSSLSIRNQKYLLHILEQGHSLVGRVAYYGQGKTAYASQSDFESLKVARYFTDFSGWNFDAANFARKRDEASILFRGLNFQGASFREGKFSGVAFEDVNLSGADMSLTTWQSPVRVAVTMNRVKAIRANFEGSSFSGDIREDRASGRSSIGESVIFRDCDLSQSLFANTKLTNVSFEDCDLSSVEIGLSRGRFINMFSILRSRVENMKYCQVPSTRTDVELFIDSKEKEAFRKIFEEDLKGDLHIIDINYFKKYSFRTKEGLLFEKNTG